MNPHRTADPDDRMPMRYEYDVLVVGAGPVGLTTAILLGSRGWRVGVVERWPHPYRLPRAVSLDDETARTLASLGLAGILPTISEATKEYEWRNGKGETLLRLEYEGNVLSGWPRASSFNQPLLEAALEKQARRTTGVDILRGWEAVGLTENPSEVRLTVVESAENGSVPLQGERTQRSLPAEYVVGCDGANSFVRSRMKTSVTDRDFHHDWLVLDVIPHDKDRIWSPDNLQICDPARPTTVVSGGPGRRRWEFMRLPGETLADLNREDRAWELLQPYDIHPGNATLERHTVYTFEARWADTWREGRLLLAGDAAHQMPPFAGQGMCSGIRDAVNLAWKLDLVLSGDAHETLMDTYTSERRQHLQHAIEASMRLGGIICEPDPSAAAERDAYMLALLREGTSPLAKLPPRVLSAGLLMRDADGSPVEPAGQLAQQGRVRFRGITGLFDQVVGTGFTLLSTHDPRPELDPASLAWCEEAGLRLLRISDDPAADGPIDVVDLEGTHLSQLTESGQTAVLVRPDHYLFGGVTRLEEVPRLVAALRDGLAGHPIVLQPA